MTPFYFATGLFIYRDSKIQLDSKKYGLENLEESRIISS